ncbi:MAG TPA: endolytic transglycosylase MltG, partial [Thermodesulfobacteriota bacterium]|nr:endolytic transglycosylase MltG [Thermodesulfobacteriota bacterium]
EFITSLGIKEGTLEGRLYPDTYKFVRNVKEEEIIRRMVKRFNGVFTEAMRQRANELGLSTQEILTLASMIEKETGAVNEKPLISAVFHNRLKRNMRFQCDPTVIYGLDNFTGNITKKELQTFTPYNTYVIEGLPPTPIANPGVESIRAALYPSKVDYLYFVSKNNGTHHFSRTMPEHNRAVDSYQRTKRSNVAPESR